MKRIIVSLVAAVTILCGCNKSNQFKVTLNLENADNQNVYLVKNLDGKKSVPVDTAVIVGNKAVLKADIDDPQAVYILVFKDAQKHKTLFPENQDVDVTGDIDNDLYISATGSATQNTYNDYQKGCAPYLESFASLEKAVYAAYETDDRLEYEEINDKMQKIWDEYHAYRLDFIKNTPDNYMVHYVLDEMKYDLELAQLKELAEILTQESAYSKNIKSFIEQNKRVEVGQPFIDFTLQTIDGEDVALAELIKNNKLTMVDFWASWCGPCRNENPVVKAAYEKYNKKGLEIIGVSIDKNEAMWLQAVGEDALPYIQVRDTKGEVANDYVVLYIPSNFLYDQNGVMVAKNLRGESLEEKLAEILK